MDGCKARAFDCWVSFVGGHVVGLTEGGGGKCCPAGETAFRGSVIADAVGVWVKLGWGICLAGGGGRTHVRGVSWSVVR